MATSALPNATRRVCVIGAGAGGLALAIRLQAAGIQTTLVEARDQVGGAIQAWERQGFRFDEGPAAIPDPGPLRELWSLAGRDLGDDCTLLEVSPHCRFSWPDGTCFDLSGDDGATAREVTRLAPGDLAGFEDFQRWREHALADGFERLAQQPQRGPLDLLRSVPLIARHQGWRSAYGLAAHFVKHDRLREALAFPALLAGGNPMQAPAFTLLTHHAPRGAPLWWPEGGMSAMAQAMAALFERLGGAVRLHDPVVQIHTLGNRAHEVETQSGWRAHFDAVASNADLVHTYRDLLSANLRGPEQARRLAARRFSPGLFTVHFGLEGSWPGIPHRSVLMGPRYGALFADLFEHGVLPQDFIMLLDHPSVTDPSLAPSGKSVFRAAIPVANLRRLPIDWETVGKLIAQRVLAEVGRRLIPDLPDRLTAVFHRSPRDHALDFNAYAGAAWSLEPSFRQSGALRPTARDAKVPNLFLVGAGVHPGAGLPAVFAGAKAAAKLMVESTA